MVQLLIDRFPRPTTSPLVTGCSGAAYIKVGSQEEAVSMITQAIDDKHAEWKE